MSEQGNRNEDRVAARAPSIGTPTTGAAKNSGNRGEQCKAPAEKGSHICYAHAGQRAMALRREGERRAVLAEAVAEMRRKGRQKFEMADLLTDFKGIQVTLAVTARAVIDGRIDCKTAGRLLVQLQMASKLLWLYHRGHRETQRTARALTTKDTKKHEGFLQNLRG